ncbi:hypothetical protein AAFF_G00373360 [Aldrovandia affinis]|uniref:Uncharacterized protein n=1 Tax=Aldrovandia affinis TaxID=143900 RepID=A0AAD7WM38_9TELE|nr:hypothetical protein AAFF_G00373360 [Aldrovandia affinis]
MALAGVTEIWNIPYSAPAVLVTEKDNICWFCMDHSRTDKAFDQTVTDPVRIGARIKKHAPPKAELSDGAGREGCLVLW